MYSIIYNELSAIYAAQMSRVSILQTLHLCYEGFRLLKHFRSLILTFFRSLAYRGRGLPSYLLKMKELSRILCQMFRTNIQKKIRDHSFPQTYLYSTSRARIVKQLWYGVERLYFCLILFIIRQEETDFRVIQRVHWLQQWQIQQIFIYIIIIVLLMSNSEFEELEQGEEISDKEESSQFITSRHAARKQLCDVCEAALYKYTCPRCRVKSCGVGCLNKHKKSSGCSGVADPFPKLQSKHIEEREVEKDYLFVKQMLSNADKVKRTLTGVETLSQQPKRFKIMRINAKKLYNINIYNAPSIIERHRENISFYFVKTKTFYWVVELLYWRQQKNKEAFSRVVTPPEPDSKTPIELLPDNFLCRDLLEKGINTQKKEQFHIFIERKERDSALRCAIQLKKEVPLREGLINQTIYEFPTLIIVHSSLVASYLSYKKPVQK